MANEWYCKNCGDKIPKRLRHTKLTCNGKCRNDVYNKNKKNANKEDLSDLNPTIGKDTRKSNKSVTLTPEHLEYIKNIRVEDYY